ncbi:MAG: DUF4215 domain-containing protein [Deltaproteobacteria bacterium]|nr:DUF4215 domain-containing protein [Deltaproteobacteria bacterium]
MGARSSSRIRLVIGAAAAAIVSLALGPLAGGCSNGGDDPVPPDDVLGGDAGAVLPEGSADGDNTPPPLTCGNEKIDPGEECDDGNTTSGDGCSGACKIESGGANDLCDGTPITLAQQGSSTLYTGRVAGSTAKLFHHYAGTCGGGSAADAVYGFVPASNGRATVRITAGFSALVYARSACADTKTELACADAIAAAGSEAGTSSKGTIAFPVFAGKPVSVFVDGYGGAKGDFVLDLEVQTALCGNGKAEPPEQCDDGNTNGGDGCSATCSMEDVATVSACPGMGYRLKPGSVSFAGDTTPLTNAGGSAVGCTPSGSGPNAVYAITPTVAGNVELKLLASYPEALVHVRRECGDSATQFDCRTTPSALTPLSTSMPVDAEETIYVYVDGNTSSKGLYVLDATLTPSACGNGKIDSGEECDDGNTTAGDGCSPTCAIERDPATYTCPGKLLRLEAAAPGVRTLKVRGTTSPLPGESVPASKFSTCGSTAPDVVYQVTSDIDGLLTATVGGGMFNGAVSVRAACPGTADLACGKAGSGNDPDTLTVAMNKETPYFVVVDGSTAGKSGPFELTLSIAPSVCGNGVVEGGETCDDGAKDDGDGCSASCTLETDTSRDECTTAAPIPALSAKPDGSYEGRVVSGTTNLTHPPSPTHTLSPCSSTGPDGWWPVVAPIDGVMTAVITSATFKTSLGVRTACAPSGTQLTCDATSGNGGQEITFPVTQGATYYLGVSGSFVSGATQLGRFTMDLKVVPSGCGDTYVTPPEACDDGNKASGDGCSATCTVESLPGIGACPGHAIALTATGTQVRRATATVNTTPLSSSTAGACGGSGPEGILKITPDVSGQLQIRATAGFNTVLHARTTCNDPLTEIAKPSCSSSNLPVVNATVTKNVPIYVFVDGVNGASGVAKLQISVTP